MYRVRYRWFRAEIWDGVRWVRLNRTATRRQREMDRLFAANEKLLAELRA